MKHVTTNSASYLIKTIIYHLKEGIYDPSYQDESYQMSAENESKVIENIILGVPLPSAYFLATDTNGIKVVKGRNILCAIEDFILIENFELEGLKIMPQYNGMKFSDLPDPVRFNILQTKWNVNHFRTHKLYTDELINNISIIYDEV